MKKVVSSFIMITATVLTLFITFVTVLVSADVSEHQDDCVVYSKVSATPVTTAYSITDDEREILARLVWNEAGLCGDDCQRAIVSVTFNQLNAGWWGKSYMNIITNSSIYVGAIPEYLDRAVPDKRIYDNIDYVLNHGTTIPSDVCYFRNNYGWENGKNPWEGYETVAVYDNVFFGHFVNGNH